MSGLSTDPVQDTLAASVLPLANSPNTPRVKSSDLYATERTPLIRPRPSPTKREGSRDKTLTAGRSTFGQSLFNSIAALLGVGILSEPFGFAQAGWIAGTVLTISYAFMTCYTAKILARFMREDPTIKTYTDCIRKAFGSRSMFLTTIFFFIELFTVSVVFIVLFSDSLNAVAPQYSTTTYKLLSLVILIPMAFLPLKLISYTSLLSVISTVFIGVVLIVNGLGKTEAPGSLWEWEQTEWAPKSLTGLGLSFGIFMAGFAGHAVIPSIAADMQHPEDFDTMINYAFGATSIVYAAVGLCGYLMFGSSVSDEISQDLLSTPGYNAAFTRTSMWMLVITPITKIALATRPLNTIIDGFFNIESPSLSSAPSPQNVQKAIRKMKSIGTWVIYLLSAPCLISFLPPLGLILAIVVVAISVPNFGVIMSLLGAFSAFGINVILPLAADILLHGSGVGTWKLVLLGASVVMGVWGTGAALGDQLDHWF
ncbi:hypothetical protein DL93DRAFT_2056652 [Clavulina sp. PMI_390]|nr:hypothetical protein DL93DRAFT_2056652 [Clavulina sp. PMI_390]